MFISSQLTPEHKYLIISLITIGYSLTEFAVMGGYNFAMIDIAPDYFGILQGINKTISLAPGFIIPLIISALTPNVIMFFIFQIFLEIQTFQIIYLGNRRRMAKCFYFVWFVICYFVSDFCDIW